MNVWINHLVVEYNVQNIIDWVMVIDGYKFTGS
jgi:hypothetical protein